MRIDIEERPYRVLARKEAPRYVGEVTGPTEAPDVEYVEHQRDALPIPTDPEGLARAKAVRRRYGLRFVRIVPRGTQEYTGLVRACETLRGELRDLQAQVDAIQAEQRLLRTMDGRLAVLEVRVAERDQRVEVGT